MKTQIAPVVLTALALALATPALAQTYTVTDLGTLDGNPSFATGVNGFGQVSGYSAANANTARAWRFTPGIGLEDLGSFGGADNRSFSLNEAGQVTGYSTDTNGAVRGFIFNDGTGLQDIGSFGVGDPVFPQHINGNGQVAGFASSSGLELPFLLASPSNLVNLGTLPLATVPASAAAYGVNDSGRVVGVGSWQFGFNRAFRTGTNGVNLQQLGTLGGDESWAYAINNAGQVAGTAQPITADSHAFLFTDGAGMNDLGTLGGFNSAGLALNNVGSVVGWSQNSRLDTHAFVWSASPGMRDLNDLIPVNAGWLLQEAHGVSDNGLIVGNGLLNGQPRAFLLAPFFGADTNPPVAVLQSADITNVSTLAHTFAVVFWDNVAVAASSIGSNTVRVTGPNGFNQLATFTGLSLTNNSVKLTATYSVSPPGGIWNGTNNGVYSVSVDPGLVRDLAGNSMPAGVAGAFSVATETTPVAGITGPFSGIMGQSLTFTFTARGSFPYASSDLFTFIIDWNGDGRDMQTNSGLTGISVSHVFTSIGTHFLRATVTDPQGLVSPPAAWNISIVNPAPPNQWTSEPVLTGARRLAVGVNSNGTLLVMGGLPLKQNAGTVQTLAPGAPAWVDAHRLSSGTIGLGAGFDALNRIVLFGGIEPSATVPNTNGVVYDPVAGPGAAIAPKHFAVHDFAFTADGLHRLYSIGGAGAVGFPGADSMSAERYDALANSWAVLAPLPQPRVNAAAAYDGRGHILVFGGLDPTTGLQTATVFSCDIATGTWSQLGNAPIGFGGTVAVLGADGLVYLIGGTSPVSGVSSAATFVFDPQVQVWFAGPALITARSAPAAALSSDGFIWVMGGDNPSVGGGNGLSSTERLDTTSLAGPLITSTAVATGIVNQAYSYQMIASGNPRPSFSVASGPAGMNVDSTNGLVSWLPASDQAGSHSVTVRATNSVGVAEQLFSINVHAADTIPPSVPTNFILVTATPTNLAFTWSAATDNVGVHHYRLWHLVGTRTRFWAVAADGITNRSVVYTTLGGTAYAVSALDAAGNESPRSAQVFAATLTPPVIFHANPSEPASVIVGNGFLYTLAAASARTPFGFSSFSGPAGMVFSPTSGPVTNNAYAVVQWMPTGAQVGTNYFTVTASSVGASASATFSVLVYPAGTDFIPPAPVALLVANPVSWDSCTLTWTPAADNIGVANYLIQATHFGGPDQPNQVIVTNASGGVTSLVLTGLNPSFGYTISITPSDVSGNVGGATSIFITTQPQRLVVLRQIRVTPGDVDFTWNSYGQNLAFTLESTDSLTTPNWLPVPPLDQWPTLNTNFSTAIDNNNPGRFYRIRASVP
jgi:probable HAF family extracellular repeat protein